MEIYNQDSQIGRYLRRVQLGLRFLAHGARAQTTCQWTGLTPDQLVTVRRRSGVPSEERMRGPSPSSFAAFFRSTRISNQSALFVAICSAIGAARDHASIELGERLCEAFEIFREWAPESDLEFEQAILLMRGSVRALKITLVECVECYRPMLLDKMGVTKDACHRCRRLSEPARTSHRRTNTQFVLDS
jgi:hypothetical protein